jgi:hypothetical protein
VGPTSPTDDELANRMADLLERARANGRKQGRREIEGSIQTSEPSSLSSSQSDDAPPPSNLDFRLQTQDSRLQTAFPDSGLARRSGPLTDSPSPGNALPIKRRACSANYSPAP